MKFLVIFVGVSAIACLLGPQIASSNYSMFDSNGVPVVQPTSEPSYTPPSSPYLYDDTMVQIGDIHIYANKPIQMTVTEVCPPSRDYAHTYIDVNSEKLDTGPSPFRKTYNYDAGTYDIYVDNICAATHVLIKYR